MPTLHDSAARASLVARLNRLTPTAQRQWGTMTVDQMLWHVNQAFETGLGRNPLPRLNLPVPRFLLRFFVLSLPWPKGKARTHPMLEAKASYDFATERARTIKLMEESASRPLEGTWPESYAMGPLSGKDWSRLGFKHVDHHLKQFGV